ncbi:hypothetical protein [Streptomyces tateyamensis]|uniref:hypothetical protein n=1 Tax=Streptomyces tateyamensis TaxID=565073 RepID=UPI00248292A7|nr:hypothetical protein [Streptomyces tateyamensis]
MLEHLAQLQVPAHRQHRFQQAVHPVPSPARHVQLRLQFLQQVVQLQLRHVRGIGFGWTVH